MLTFTSCQINIKNACLETASSVSRRNSELIAKSYCDDKRSTVREGPDISVGDSSLSDIRKLSKGIPELANIMVTFYVFFWLHRFGNEVACDSFHFPLHKILNKKNVVVRGSICFCYRIRDFYLKMFVCNSFEYLFNLNSKSVVTSVAVILVVPVYIPVVFFLIEMQLN